MTQLDTDADLSDDCPPTARTTTRASARELRWMHRYTLLTATTTFFLVLAGAHVKSTGSGLAVPDWPLSFGQLLPPMIGGVFWEHGHRMVATAVGLLTVGLAVWYQRSEPRPWARGLAILALGLVVTQGCLGGATVLLSLPPAVSILHAGLAELFFALMAGLALMSSPWWRDPATREETGGEDEAPVRGDPLPLRGRTGVGGARVGLYRATIVTALVVYVQILLGALVRHFGAGLAFSDFPLAGGRLVPSIDSLGQGLHFAHRVGALTVALLAAWTIRKAWRAAEGARTAKSRLRGAAALFGAAVTVQVSLGAAVIWTQRIPWIASIHLAAGAFTLAAVVLLVLTATRVLPVCGHGEGAGS